MYENMVYSIIRKCNYNQSLADAHKQRINIYQRFKAKPH